MIKRLAVALVLALTSVTVTTAVTAPPANAAASSDVTPMLTGGVVHWAGTADRDEKATDTAAATLTNSTDVGEADSPIAWNTHTLVDFHYPDAPKTDFEAGAPIMAYDETYTTDIGANGPQHYNEHFVDCDDTPDGVTCDHTVTKDIACSWTQIGGTVAAPVGPRDDFLEIWGDTQNLSCPGLEAWEQAAQHSPWNTDTPLYYELKMPDKPYETDTLGPLHLTHNATLDNECQMVARCDSDTQTGSSDVTVSCALCVTGIDFEQRDVTTGNWTPIARDQATYDGNTVRMLVTVHNATTTAIQAPVRFRDLTVKRDLVAAKNGEHPTGDQSFPANQDTTLTFDWDTNGFAWDKGATSAPHQIAVLTPYGGGRVDQLVAPRPIVLVHGLNSSAATWDSYVGDGGFVAGRRSDWIARAVQMNTSLFFGSTIHTNSGRLAEFITQLQDETGAEHIDLVGHSMGGLISRDYLNTREPSSSDGQPVVRRLVELGTPNLGTDCAALGVAAAAVLAHPAAVFALTTIAQLTPAYLSVFNRQMPGFNGTKVSVEAGDIGSHLFCNPANEHDDEIVPVSSAWWTIADHGVMAGLKHTAMTGSRAAWTSWVGPHLALDTDGHSQFAAAAPALARPTRSVRAAAAAAPSTRLAVVAAPTVPGHGRASVPVSVPRGESALAVQLVAGSTVDAQLVNPAGRVVDSQRGTSAAGSLGLRSLHVSKPTAGRWTVQLANTGGTVQPTVAEAGLVGDPVSAAGQVKQATKGGPLTLTMRLRKSGRAYPGQHVTARVRFEALSKPTQVTLHDDGRNGDAHARDGIYSARLPRRAAGTVDVLATAATGHGTAWAALQYLAS